MVESKGKKIPYKVKALIYLRTHKLHDDDEWTKTNCIK